jgi:hypothetical protein
MAIRILDLLDPRLLEEVRDLIYQITTNYHEKYNEQ